MKIIALDLGDRWTGSALSDALGITAKPYETVATFELIDFLKKAVKYHKIEKIVIGYPLTLKGTESAQTKHIVSQKEALEQIFSIPLILWDERLTSKHASQLKKARTKEEKLKNHSIAAAFILQTFLDSL